MCFYNFMCHFILFYYKMIYYYLNFFNNKNLMYFLFIKCFYLVYNLKIIKADKLIKVKNPGYSVENTIYDYPIHRSLRL
jgi:hypothetical protein